MSGEDDEDDEDWFDEAVSEDEESTPDSEDSNGEPSEEDPSDWLDDSDDESGGPGQPPRRVSDEDWEAAWTADEPGAEPAEPLDQDFASAFEDAPGPDGPSMPGGVGGSRTEEFDDSAFESDMARIDIGIEGLDAMIQGGIPERSLMVAIGDAGTGKTTFGLHFLQHALQSGENAVFITLEESHERIIDTAEEKGWEFSKYLDQNQLVILDLDPIEMSNSLTSIRNELPALIQDFGASRLVLDSVSLLEMMYDSQATRRNQIYDFTRSLKEAGVTTMLTSEASETDPYHSRFGIIEYLTDAVFILRYIRPEDFRETRLAVEIQKIRDANHSREMKPFEITNDGIAVYRQANIF